MSSLTRTQAGDPLADSDAMARWLATLPTDAHDACATIAAALQDIRSRPGPITAERQRSVLAADYCADALHAELIEEYAAYGSKPDRKLQVLATLSALNVEFAAHYDALLNALRALPMHVVNSPQSKLILTRRLSHWRQEMVLRALRGEQPPAWQKIHRLYRLSGRQTVHGVNSAGESILPSIGELAAESEYIQILLIHQLTQARLAPFDIVHTLGGLAQWAGDLTITQIAGDNAFAVYPNGSGGLVPPPQVINSGLLWLDVTPLRARIESEIGGLQEERVTANETERLSLARRIALLNRLLDIWNCPAQDSRRRERRRQLTRKVHVALDFGRIAQALQLQGTGANAEQPAASAAPVGAATDGADRETWMVIDVSESGCRLRGTWTDELRAGPGTLVAIRRTATRVWIAGFVRSVLRVGSDVELGVKVISTSMRLLTLRNHVLPVAAGALVPFGDSAANEGAAPDSAPGLLMVPGAGHLPAGQLSLIVKTGDFTAGRVYFCETRRSRYRLTLEHAIEWDGDYVWATISAVKVLFGAH